MAKRIRISFWRVFRILGPLQLIFQSWPGVENELHRFFKTQTSTAASPQVQAFVEGIRAAYDLLVDED